MARCEVKRGIVIGLLLFGMALHDAAAATVAPSGDALDADLSDEARPAGAPSLSSVPAAEPVTSVRVAAPQPAPERTQSANPLWGIPLTQLSGTRDRPIFSPSRRPPPVVTAEPVQVRPPPPRKKPVEPPPLSLVGTIASEDESYGIFLDPATKEAIRLKVGDDYQGWQLRTIQGREVTIEKDQQAAVLALPEPGGSSGGDVRMIPVTANKMPVARER
jgi:general secretion pathway protein N